MGTTLILEMARAYGLRPRLWLLVLRDVVLVNLTVCTGFTVERKSYFS